MACILIVEDNPDLLSILEQLLSEEHEVYTAMRGEDAIELAKQHHPQVVLLDLQLPAMDGIETGKWIKQELQGDVAILVLTALSGKTDEETVLASGCCDAFLSKPAPLATIRSRVADLLGEPERAA